MKIVVVLLLGMVIIAAASILFAAPTTNPPPQCMDEKTREKIRQLALGALDQGFHDHVKLLYEQWMKDSHDQPRRAQNGIKNGIAAYLRALDDAQKWSPPIC